MLVIVNQFIIQYAISQKANDAYSINISGKQRMLSQKIIALAAENKEQPSQSNSLKLKNTFEEWEKVHYGFQYGNKEIGLEKLSKENILLVKALDQYVEKAKEKIEQASDNSNTIDIKDLANNQNLFLVKMDKIVKKLESDSDERLQFIKYIELLLAAITISFIMAEVLLIFLPITKNLQRKNKSLENTNKTLAEYNYAASHDLRTPVINILSFANLLKNRKGDNIDEEEKAYLDFIIQGAESMDEMTNDLMHFSLLKEINKEMVETKKVIEEVDNLFKKNKAYELIVKEIPVEIEADKMLIKTVFKNIIDNSLKFVEPNKKPCIIISGAENDLNYSIKIEDNGIGIKAHNKEKIFGIFKRLNNKKLYNGSGIGLSIVKKIIDLHDGEIWVESEINTGTVVNFTLPKSKKSIIQFKL